MEMKTTTISSLLDPRIDLSGFKVYVFVPYEKKKGKEDEYGSESYDTALYRADVAKWFKSLNCEYVWTPITFPNMKDVVQSVLSDPKPSLVINFCDGTELDQSPGISVVKLLEDSQIPFTGARHKFFFDSTSKAITKRHLQNNNVSTSPFVEISLDSIEADVEKAERVVGYPFIIKPIYSAASEGIHQRSVCYDKPSAITQVKSLFQMKYYGENGVFIESFIEGREFTALVVETQDGVCTFPVVERAFNDKVPLNKRLLTYEWYWEVPNPIETPLSSVIPPGETLYSYKKADPDLQPILQDLATRAFKALKGTGYARVDMRMRTHQDGTPIIGTNGLPIIYVLEVNAQCGISSSDDTSVGWIKRFTDYTVIDLIGHNLTLAVVKAQRQLKEQIGDEINERDI